MRDPAARTYPRRLHPGAPAHHCARRARVPGARRSVPARLFCRTTCWRCYFSRGSWSSGRTPIRHGGPATGDFTGASDATHLLASQGMAESTKRDHAAPDSGTDPPGRREWVVLAVALTASVMAIFDLFVVNIAMAHIRRELSAGDAAVALV